MLKKILVLSTVHLFDDNRILYKEIESLKKMNCDITYAVQYPSNLSLDFIDIRIYPLPIIKNKFNRLFFLQKKIYNLMKAEKFDIIHFHDPELLFLAYFIKKKFHCKILFDVHENISASILDKNWLPKFSRKFLAMLYSTIEMNITKNFDKIIIAEKSYRKIYGPDSIEILNFPKLLPEKNEKDYDKMRFVYAGDISEIRGIWQMLDIFKIIRAKNQNASFDLIGRFVSEKLKTNVEKFILQNRLNNKIKIHGRLNINQVNDILKTSTVGFALLKPIPNYLESLPTKIFDYMNNKIFVIASNFPLYTEYIDRPQTGITLNYNSYQKQLTDSIKVISNPNKVKEMAENGYRLVKKSCNWQGEEKKLNQIYEELLG
jgi:glycosyltransferase involved in cell wall biosynthesis